MTHIPRFVETESQTKELAKECTEYNLWELVGDEVHEWSESKLKDEAWKSARIILGECQHSHLDIYDLLTNRSLTLWQNDMGRIRMDKLNIDDKEKAVLSYDFWPNSMDKWRCREILEKVEYHDIPQGCLEKAHSEVECGIYDKLTDI